jgi:ribosomal RNA-processing protein 1
MVEGEGSGSESKVTVTEDKTGTNAEVELAEDRVSECQLDTVSGEGTVSTETKPSKQKMKSSKRKVTNAMADPVANSSRSAFSNTKKAKKRSNKKVSEISVDTEVAVEEKSDFAVEEDPTILSMDDSVISNLKRQFDLLAEEMSESDACLSPVPTITPVSPRNTGSKKKKAVVCPETMGTESPNEFDDQSGIDTSERSISSSTKVKKVTFALKKNLVWRPTSPLPPESVRVPPSATPRGSALKKGVPPGPIISETKSTTLKQRKGTPRRPQNNVQSILKKPKPLSNRRNSL